MSASKVPQAFPASRAHALFVFIGFCQVFQSFWIQETFSTIVFLGCGWLFLGLDDAA